ncbi:glycerol dehydrogenase [Enterococcus sp. LJL51]|uniref:glycerol dehydrogenase n=1 Tax=Enterococcus sp. LJL51 TaxID=3416656 RepID=UPI003CF6D15E
MEKLFISPSKYVQGKGCLKDSSKYIEELGNRVLILTDEFVWGMIGEGYKNYLTEGGLLVGTAVFSGEVSEENIQELLKGIADKEIEVVIALGGGKVIDLGKAVAAKQNLKMVVLPTTASTDAPTSSISVLYEEDGRFKEYQFYRKNPDLVIVDTEVIVNAPARLLAAGIADGLSTAVEARAVKKKHGENVLGKKPTLTALAIAEKCEEVLFTYGLQAYEDNKNKQVTEAFEAVVEANTLMSGLGFESGGLAAAHALHNGFSAIQGKVNQLMHGEKIAYTTLVQLVLEKQPEEVLKRYLVFFRQLNLPTTCEALGLDVQNEKELSKIAEQSLSIGDSLRQMPFTLTKEDIVQGIRQLDAFVRSCSV